MASTLSNLYVERASSEHPLALWMLNEQVDYVSQITEAERQFQLFATWQLTNAEAISESSRALGAPFLDSSTSRIIGAIPPDPTMDIVLTSQYLLSEDLVSSLGNFNIGMYINLQTALANTVSIGYKYTDVTTSEEVEVLSTQNVKPSYRGKWTFFSNTFDLPPGPLVAEDVKLVIKVNVSQGDVAGGYDFFINGLSVGQWSEEFNKTSFGVTPSPIPSDIDLPSSLKSLPAFPYGTSGENAYYLSQGFELFAKNFGVPLVFGSSNVTKLSPNVINGMNFPSLIFPGYGFLNERGRYNSYTVEMWIRVNAESSRIRRIFGPIDSTDGLYVDGAFLTLKIGNSVASHFVGDWFRPMLIHIRLVGDSAILILNGEEVISLDIDQTTIELPSEFNQSMTQSKDWLGFYAYEDVDPIDVDTFSIYSYSMPTDVAKRRWVWGQAVAPPEQTNSSINSITAFNDYAFANYAANYNYPDFANWKQAFFSNVNAESRSLSLPDYALPDFRIGDRTIDQLYRANFTPLFGQEADRLIGENYITLFPNLTWDSDTDYVYFENFAILNEPVQTVYGVFKTDGTEENKTLIKITNKLSNDYVLVSVNNSTVTYKTSFDGTSHTIATRTIVPNEKFAVGLDIQKLSRSQDSEINRFFTDQSSLDMYVAGDGTSKFNGKIYKIGFDAGYNSRKTSWMYDDTGIVLPNIQYTITDAVFEDGEITFTTSINHNYLIGDRLTISGVVSDPEDEFDLERQIVTRITDNTFTILNTAEAEYTSGGTVTDTANILFKHTANYTLTSITKYGLSFPDIAVAGYWEDYMPLSYFGKSIVDYDEQFNYELDSIQFNQDFPQPATTAASLEISQWTYSDLQIEYSVPTILTYEDVDNEFYTGWENYEQMSQNSIRTSFYDTEDSILRSYISFQKIKDGANKNLTDFNTFAKPLTSGIIDPAAFDLDWQQTAFEVTSGTVIYPPAATYSTNNRIDFNDYAIVYHLDFKSDGIFHHPVRFKELQLASQVLERTDFTPVGSRFGIPVYYYTKNGLYYDLKAKNPISTYKKSTPYLYLDRQSGWKIRGEFSSLTDRGIAIPVNLSAAERTEVSSIQMWIRFSEIDFPEDPIMVFSIEHNKGTYDFFIQSDSSSKRGYIFGVNRETTEVLDDIGYYLNGQSVFSPFLVQEEWVVLGLEFPELLDFSFRTGAINLNGPLTYNNISYNLATNIEKNETLQTRSWSDMLSVHVGGVTAISSTGTQVTYTTTNTFIQGEVVSVSGVVPSQYDVVEAVVVSATANTFTIASTATGTYVSGGTATSGKWEDLQTDLEVLDGSIPPYRWQQVKVISESRVFTIDPKAIYEKYTGSNRIVLDDESRGILIDPDRIRVFKEVTWSERLKVPV
jgi:hypothetical protein